MNQSIAQLVVRSLFALLPVPLAVTSASADQVVLNITQVAEAPFGLQSSAVGSFSQMSPNPANYSINDEFKFFFPPGTFLGSATGIVDSVLGIGDEGCSPSDFAGFTAGSIALMRNTNCIYSTQINNASNAGAIGTITVPIVFSSAITYSLVDPVGIPSIVISPTLGESLQQQLTAVPEPSALFLLSMGLAGLAVSQAADRANRNRRVL